MNQSVTCSGAMHDLTWLCLEGSDMALLESVYSSDSVFLIPLNQILYCSCTCRDKACSASAHRQKWGWEESWVEVRQWYLLAEEAVHQEDEETLKAVDDGEVGHDVGSWSKAGLWGHSDERWPHCSVREKGQSWLWLCCCLWVGSWLTSLRQSLHTSARSLLKLTEATQPLARTYCVRDPWSVRG